MKLWFLVFLFCTSCATRPRAEVEHYTGEITLKIPGAATPFARLPIVVRFTSDPVAGLMMEELIMPGRDEKSAAREIVYNYKAKERPGVFEVRDNLKSFRGIVHFTGTAWHWDSWNLHIIMKDGSRVRGSGQKLDQQVRTIKTVYSAKGSPLFIQRELLQAVSPTEYKTRRRQIVKRELKYIKN